MVNASDPAVAGDGKWARSGSVVMMCPVPRLHSAARACAAPCSIAACPALNRHPLCAVGPVRTGAGDIFVTKVAHANSFCLWGT